MKRFKIFIPLVFILLISIFLQVNFSKILEHLTQISFLYAGGVILSLYICNFFLAALRLKFVAKQVSGEDLSYKDSCRTILMGQLGAASQFWCFLGQSIYLNKLDHLSYTSGAFITFYDKISMAVIGCFWCVRRNFSFLIYHSGLILPRNFHFYGYFVFSHSALF